MLSETVAAVAAHRPVAVVAAGEYGVELADALSEELGVPTNGRQLSPARRNKFVMIETVRAAGLRAARQKLVEDERALVDWPARSAAGAW